MLQEQILTTRLKAPTDPWARRWDKLDRAYRAAGPIIIGGSVLYLTGHMVVFWLRQHGLIP